MAETKFPDADLPFKSKCEMAIAGLLSHAVFEGSLVCRMKHIVLEPGDQMTAKVKTMATDCVSRVWINKEYCTRLSPGHIRTVLAHEALHAGYLHGFGHEGKDPDLLNIAQDFVINRDLYKAGHDFSAWKHTPLADVVGMLDGTKSHPPKGEHWIMLDVNLPDDQSSEDIYETLVAAKLRNKQKSPQPPEGAAMQGDVDSDGAAEAAAEQGKTPEELQVDAMVAAAEALSAAKAMGKLPGHLERLAARLEAPKIQWVQVLRKFVKKAMGPGVVDGEYAYRRPNRRVVRGIILPRLEKKPAPEIVVVLDTSGSIGGPEIDKFMSELNAIVKNFKPQATHVLSIDHVVQDHTIVKPGENVVRVVRPKGGGGTDMTLAFQWVAERRMKPACVIFLTDGYTPFGSPQKYPVLWAITTNVVAPHGKTMHF